MRKRFREVFGGTLLLLAFSATAFSAVSNAEFFSLCGTGTTKAVDAAIKDVAKSGEFDRITAKYPELKDAITTPQP